jgi:hypothetical protein
MRNCVLVLMVCSCCMAAQARTIYVDVNGGGDYATIQQGVDAATPGDTVAVVLGTYVGALNREIDPHGKAITICGAPGREVPTIDCQYLGRGFAIQSGEAGGTLIEDLAIVRGYADGGGGGMLITNGSSPTIKNCQISYCEAEDGGGMEVSGMSNPTVIGCAFIGNEAYVAGGGLRCNSTSSPSVKTCRFELNEAYYGGGIMSRGGSCPAIDGTLFRQNSATFSGGLRCEEGSPVLTDLTFIGNSATSGGGMGSGPYSTVTLRHATFLNNSASMRGGGYACGTPADIAFCTFVGGASPRGGGMFCGAPEGNFTMTNSVVAFNSSGGVVVCDPGFTPTITHCCVFGNAGGDSLCGDYHDNIFSNPLFCGLPHQDLTIEDDSPCAPANNPWGEYVGAHEIGCPGTVAVQARSWSSIKAMFR